MTHPSSNSAETITVSANGSEQTIIDVLQDQYGVLDSGEVRARLESLEPNVWTSDEFSRLFEVSNIHAPYVDVIRKQDGVAGTVMFIDCPRFYFTFNAGSTDNERSTA